MRGMNPHYNHVKLHSFLPYYIRAFASFCEVLPSLKSECSRGSVLVVDYSMGISFLPMIPLKGTWEIPKMISKIVFDGQNTATLKKYTVYTVYIIYHTVNVLWYIYPWCILCIYIYDASYTHEFAYLAILQHMTCGFLFNPCFAAFLLNAQIFCSPTWARNSTTARPVGWTTHARQIGSILPSRVEHKTCLKPPNPGVFLGVVLSFLGNLWETNSSQLSFPTSQGHKCYKNLQCKDLTPKKSWMPVTRMWLEEFFSREFPNETNTFVLCHGFFGWFLGTWGFRNLGIECSTPTRKKYRKTVGY